MASNPKHRSPRKGELPFDDSDVLKADDPRPQRVPQYPATGARRALKKVEKHIPPSVFDNENQDEELRATYGSSESHKPSFLYVERGPGAGQLVQLKQGPLVIGRASVSDLRLQHPSISRRHAQFKRIGEQFFVKDLGSQNGTFVNKNKIQAEIEVFPGDLIAMGNALLKLRGPLAKGEGVPVKAKDNKLSPRKAALRTSIGPSTARASTPPKTNNSVVKVAMVKVAIVAGAMVFGLGGMLAFALVKGVSLNAPLRIATRALPKPAVEPELDIVMDDVKVQQNKKVDDAISKKMHEKQSALAAEKKAAGAQKEEEAAAAEGAKPVVVAKASSPSKKAVAEEEEAEPAAKSGSPNAKKSAILASYEKGNAEASLEAAKKANDRDLTAKLTEFIAAHEAADNAVNSNNGGAAIKSFEKALKLDEQLSSGFGVYGGKIRKQLSNLYTLVGLQHLKNDNTDHAKLAFQAALKNDPENDRAKSQLAKLGGGARASEDADEEEKPAVKKKAAAPAKRPAADTKSRSQAIDDAFGD